MALGNSGSFDPSIDMPPGIGSEMPPGFGREMPPSFRQFALGVIGGCVLGFFGGLMSPWQVRFPVGKGGVMESVFGGMVVTPHQTPVSTATKAELGVQITTNIYAVDFSLPNAVSGQAGSQLYVSFPGDGWPVSLGLATATHTVHIEYEWTGLVAKRRLIVLDGGVPKYYEFTSARDGDEPSQLSSSVTRMTDDSASLIIHFSGYKDAIPLKVMAPSP